MRQEAPSNQMAFPGLGLDGQELMDEVRTWEKTYGREDGNGAWERMVLLAQQQARRGRISAKYIVEVIRNE